MTLGATSSACRTSSSVASIERRSIEDFHMEELYRSLPASSLALSIVSLTAERQIPLLFSEMCVAVLSGSVTQLL